MQKAIAIDCDEHAPVDHRNQMRIRDAVEQMPRPGTVDAAEEHVTVERRRKAFRTEHARWHPAHAEVAGRRHLARVASSDLHLEAALLGIRCERAGGAIEIPLLDMVMVNQRYVTNAEPRQRLVYQAPDATEPDYTDSAAHQIRLGALTPDAHRSHLAARAGRDRP